MLKNAINWLNANSKRKRAYQGLLLALVVTVFILVLSVLNVFDSFELKTMDLRWMLRGPIPTRDDVAFIEIDDPSVAALGRWPWSRVQHALMVGVLSIEGFLGLDLPVDKIKPKVIAFDVFFPERTSIESPLYCPDGIEQIPFAEGSKCSNHDKPGVSPDEIFSDVIAKSNNVYSSYYYPNLTQNPKDRLTGIKPEEINPIPEVVELYMDGISVIKEHAYKNAPGTEKFNHSNFVVPTISDFTRTARNIGFVQVKPDQDGVTRRYPLFIRYIAPGDTVPYLYASLSFQASLDFMQVPKENVIVRTDKKYVLLKGAKIDKKVKDIYIPIDEHGQMYVNWTGGWSAKHFHHKPFIDVATAAIASMEGGEMAEQAVETLSFFKDKICFIGATATGTVDFNPIPFEPRYPMVGVHANVIDTILNQRFLKDVDWKINLLLMIAFGLIIGIVVPQIKPVFAWILTILLLGVQLGGAYLLFARYGSWISVVDHSLVIVFSSLSIFTYNYILEEREKRKTRGAFQYYLNPSVIEKILEDPESLKLGGEERVMTVFFSDIRSFSTISEKMTPPQLVEYINNYLTPMTDIVFEFQGTVDKYIGDAIMAFWGAPIYTPDHALLACKSALKQLGRLKELNEKYIATGFPPLKIGIGINTGKMNVGNMGSQQRFNYTLMGDEVNLGSRLEGITKYYGVAFIVSEATYLEIKDKAKITARELDVVRVKGKTQPVGIYEIIDIEDKPA